MGHVFLSYARSDLDRAKKVAAALEKAGLAVWWDRRLDGGTEYSRAIEEALNASAAVVALWSESSVNSAWVRDEAAKGRDHGKLIPATLDGTAPPLGFGQLHTIDLSARGRRRSAALNELVESALQRVGHTPAPGRPAPMASNPMRHRNGLVAAGLVLLMAAGAIFLWRNVEDRRARDRGTVVVGRFETLAAGKEGRRIARLVEASIERTFATNFIDTKVHDPANPVSGKGADFALAGTVDVQGGESSVSANITDVRSGTLLWSTQRTRGAGDGRLLANEMALWLADVLRCSIFIADRMEAGRDTQIRSIILRWCEAERSRGDQFQQMPAIAEQLVEAAPDSAHSHGYLAMGLALGRPERRNEVYAASRKALKLNAATGPAYFALAAVPDPAVGFVERDRLLREGMRLDPDFPYNKPQLGFVLLTLGRHQEGMGLFEEFAADHPLDFQQGAFLALLRASSGNLSGSRRDFERIETLRPGFPAAAREATMTELLFGEPERARALLPRWNPTENDRKCVLFAIEARQSRRPVQAGEILANCESRAALPPELLLGLWGHVEEALTALRRNLPRYAAVPRFGPRLLFFPGLEKLRADPRFIEALVPLGIPQYWLGTGRFPDFCETERLPYDCRKAAARFVAAADSDAKARPQRAR